MPYDALKDFDPITVAVQAPKEPITINLNVKLDADVRVRLERHRAALGSAHCSRRFVHRSDDATPRRDVGCLPVP